MKVKMNANVLFPKGSYSIGYRNKKKGEIVEVNEKYHNWARVMTEKGYMEEIKDKKKATAKNTSTRKKKEEK